AGKKKNDEHEKRKNDDDTTTTTTSGADGILPRQAEALDPGEDGKAHPQPQGGAADQPEGEAEPVHRRQYRPILEGGDKRRVILHWAYTFGSDRAEVFAKTA